MTERRLDVPKPPRPKPVAATDPAPGPNLAIDVSGFSDSNGSTDVIDPEVRAALAKASSESAGERTRVRPARSKPKSSRPKTSAKDAATADEAKLRRKRNALVPHRLVPALRDRAADDQVPHGEVVVDAFVNHIDAVRAELEAEKGDSDRRQKLGLPPRRRRQPRLGEDELERRVQVGLYMPTQAIEVIDKAAGEFGISWSYLVSLVLDRELTTSRS